jgi:3,4-dihydroxy-9,10-secoandrosta-1,3,5(10)-triene-9,17-dione 4,5-dioxygenase
VAIECLGYVIVRSDKREEWEGYLTKVVGAMKAPSPDDADHYRIDHRPFRFRIVDAQGQGDRLIAAGYRIDSRGSLDALAARLEEAGHETAWVSEDDAATRGVEAAFKVNDPAGNHLEFYVGDSKVDTPFASPIGVEGFVTGELGMGHAVFAAMDFDRSMSFYRDVIGFHPTDLPRFRFLGTPDDPGIPFAFLHADNGRHHSVAFGPMPPMPGGCVHLMLEMTTLKDVEDCYRRMSEFGVAESASIGEHTNDQITSFYMKTPAGFDLEIGYDGLVIDPSSWKVTAHNTPSKWGHEWAWMKAMAQNNA